MCCQEMGEKEATVALFCPKAAYDEPKVRKVNTIKSGRIKFKGSDCLNKCPFGLKN